jgi:Ca-activated chloride channel family protein
MEGEKFRQAQDALVYILEHLNPEDRFNVVAFSTGVDQYARGLQPASQAAEAIGWVERLSAAGSTDINRALLESTGMAQGERPTYVIFLTDGLPTEGVTESQLILDNLARSAPEELRLFAFGVGYDVDTFLLDSLAQAHHGSSSYVLPGERLDEALSAFYARISTPVLTNLALDFGSLGVFDLYPQPLPDLFAGSQLVLVGRYRAGGRATLTLTGEVNGQRQTFRFPEQFFATRLLEGEGEKVDRALPRLWATRKIGHLLNRIRLQGPDQETVDQIVKLSIRYGIVTPYTSYLVTEEMPLGLEQQDRIVEEQFRALQAMPTAPSFGEAAVERAAEEGDLAGAEAPAAPASNALELVRIVGARTFVLSDGVWVDTAFDPQSMSPILVAFLSDDYFSLLEARPELAAYFALGARVIALSGGSAYEVVGQGVQVEPVEILVTGEPVALPETPVPSTPVAQAGPGAPLPEAAPSTFPCLGGLLPLALLPLGLVLVRRRQR